MGNNTVFGVNIKWMSKVSLFALEEALAGLTRPIPLDAVKVC